jgi:hypothetical protein
MLTAVKEAGSGDILDAAINLKQAEYTAKTGVAVARKAFEISGTLLDILA